MTLAATGAQARAHPYVILVAAAAATVAVLGVVAIAAGEVRGGASGLILLAFACGLACVVAGLVAGIRRRERGTGVLMVAVGFVLFAGTLVHATESLPFTAGLAASALPAALLAHMVLAFPDGRLHRPAERIVAAAAYANAVVVNGVMLMFMGNEHLGGCPCASNRLLVRDDMSVHTTLMNAESVAAVAIAAGVVVILARRWLRASAALRRALLPVLVTGAVAGALLGAAQLFSAPPYTSAPVGVQAATLLAFAAVPFAYLAGLFRARLARAGVSDLVVALGDGLAPGQLRDAMAATLRDPSLEVGYWDRDANDYVDLEGRPVAVVETPTRAVTVIERRGERVAALVHDRALDEDPGLLDAASSAAGLAMENERLLVELRAQLERVKDSRARIVEAGDSERRRLERNLHDGAQQRLVSVSLQIGRVSAKLGSSPDEAGALLAGARDELGVALAELREIARGIHPALLTDRGLVVAVESLAERAPLPVEVVADLRERLPPPLEAAIYYVVAEGLANVARYADARSATVELTSADGVLRVLVSDDGRGGANPAAGSGLSGLSDRLEAFDGHLQVTSPPGYGTRLSAEVPLRPRDSVRETHGR